MQDALSTEQIAHFIRAGFVRLDHVFSSAIAEEARTILWKDTGLDPHDPTTWTSSVIRLGMYSQEPFIKAANMPV